MLDRLRLALQRTGTSRPKPSLARLLREGTYPLSPITVRMRRAPDVRATSNPQTVMVLPGFLAGPLTMSYLARRMRQAGHDAHHWGSGRNMGASIERLQSIERQLGQLRERSGESVTLIGWSLGGLYARELAKRNPDAVGKVITLGSPFSGDRRANNAWRLYQFVAGHAVDDAPLGERLSEKPPMETVAFWSSRDGIVAPRSARGKPHERDSAVALRCTHMGFSYAPEAIEAILQELERD